jgi:glycosyltransferase involved in cell wall biosynthesis
VADQEPKYRIGFDITAAMSQGAGIGRYTRELIRSLVKHDSRYEYRLITARTAAKISNDDPILGAENATLRTLWLNDRWLYRLWHRFHVPLRAEWLTGKIDLYHSPDYVLPPLSNALPAVLTVHDLSFIHYPEAFTQSLLRFLNNAVPRSISRATHVLADSASTKEDLQRVWNIPEAKISVVYSGVSPHFHPVTGKNILRDTLQKYNLGEKPYVLSVGTLQPRKNYEMLIRAFRLVSEKVSHNLVIVGGKGWMYEQIQDEIKQQNLSNRVRLLGYADDSDLPALYSGAALFVFPSLYEGFGLPLLEAMACGVPVISSDASSLPEVTGKASIMLSPDDQAGWSGEMIDILEDPDRRTKMVAAGFLQARHFSWKESARTVTEIYHKLLSS